MFVVFLFVSVQMQYINYWQQFVLYITIVSRHAKIALEIPYSQ